MYNTPRIWRVDRQTDMLLGISAALLIVKINKSYQSVSRDVTLLSSGVRVKYVLASQNRGYFSSAFIEILSVYISLLGSLELLHITVS